jgi:branched-chain amino acid transport system permease protein
MDYGRILQIIFTGCITGGLYALVAVGLNLIYGTMRLLNIAHGEVIMVGAYIAYWCFTLYGVNPFLSLLLSGLVTSFLGLIICKIIFLPMIQTGKSEETIQSNSLLLFFAISIILTNVATLLWSADIRGYSYMTKVVQISTVPVMLNRLSAFLVALVVSIITYLLIQKTMLGKAIRALIQERTAAKLVGINSNRLYLFSFVIAFGIAGLSGALLSMIYEISPFMGMPYTITAFVVIVLGGLGNIMGSLIGGFIFGLVETIGISVTSPGLQSIISYGIFIAVILIRPKGIFGRGL